MASVKKPVHSRSRHFLKEWRKYRGINQEAVADAIEMSRSNLSKMENGKVPYEQDRLEMLARLYNCSVVELLSRNPYELPRIPIFDLPDEDAERVRQFIRALRASRVDLEGKPVETPDTPKRQVVPINRKKA